MLQDDLIMETLQSSCKRSSGGGEGRGGGQPDTNTHRSHSPADDTEMPQFNSLNAFGCSFSVASLFLELERHVHAGSTPPPPSAAPRLTYLLHPRVLPSAKTNKETVKIIALTPLRNEPQTFPDTPRCVLIKQGAVKRNPHKELWENVGMTDLFFFYQTC